MRYFILALFISCLQKITYAQVTNRIIYMVDSFPILTDLEPWDRFSPEDIADRLIISDRDSIKLMGFEQADAIVFLFTKAFRSRPDSIKKIPSLTKMQLLNGVWMYQNQIYTGHYRNYYLNGQLMVEGNLLNGKIEGEVITYFKNGIRKSMEHYIQGMRKGKSINYYKNGAIYREVEDLSNGQTRYNIYYINGQLQEQLKTSIHSDKDSLVLYYSSGKIKKIVIGYKGDFNVYSKSWDLNYYTSNFYEHLRSKNFKAANNDLYHIKQLDSDSIGIIFIEAVLLAHEFRFDRAISKFDNILKEEPLMREAFSERAACRIKKFKYQGIPLHAIEEKSFVLEDLKKIPQTELAIVCSDIVMADSLDANLKFTFNKIPDEIPYELLNYCLGKNKN